MSEQLILVVVATGALFIIVAGNFALLATFHRRVGASEALVVTTRHGARVFRNGGLVLPFLATAETVDLTAKTIPCTCKGRDALGLRDGARIDVEATFAIRVGDTSENILEAAKKIGVGRIRDAKALEELFGGRFARAIADVVRSTVLADLERDRHRVEHEVHRVASEDLQGMVIDRVVIARVEPTPTETLGPFR